MNRKEKIALAEQAKAILDNKAWIQIIDDMMEGIQTEWADCTDAVVREDLWRRQAALRCVITEIKSVIMNGDIAKLP